MKKFRLLFATLAVVVTASAGVPAISSADEAGSGGYCRLFQQCTLDGAKAILENEAGATVTDEPCFSATPKLPESGTRIDRIPLVKDDGSVVDVAVCLP